MIRSVFAAAVAATVLIGASAVSHAAPISPLPAGVANEAANGNVTLAWCGWRCRRGWGWGYRGYYGYAPGGWCRWHPYRCGW